MRDPETNAYHDKHWCQALSDSAMSIGEPHRSITTYTNRKLGSDIHRVHNKGGIADVENHYGQCCGGEQATGLHDRVYRRLVLAPAGTNGWLDLATEEPQPSGDGQGDADVYDEI